MASDMLFASAHVNVGMKDDLLRSCAGRHSAAFAGARE